VDGHEEGGCDDGILVLGRVELGNADGAVGPAVGVGVGNKLGSGVGVRVCSGVFRGSMLLFIQTRKCRQTFIIQFENNSIKILLNCTDQATIVTA